MIDVVVVSYERRDLLLRCCESIWALGDGVHAVIVDNASHDGSAEAVRERFPNMRVIETDRNVGFAAAVNRGVAAGGEPMVLLLNSDASIGASSLASLRGCLESDGSAAAVGPMIRGSRGELELSTGRTMSVVNELAFLVAGVLHRHGKGPLTPVLEWLYAHPRRTRSLTAACLLLRRAALEQIDGFDERFFLYAEDVDLCRRLRAAGWSLLYVPAARARHARGGTAREDPGATEIAYRRSQLAFYRKHHGAVQQWVLRVWLLVRYGFLSLLAGGERRNHCRRILSLLLDTHPTTRG